MAMIKISTTATWPVELLPWPEAGKRRRLIKGFNILENEFLNLFKRLNKIKAPRPRSFAPADENTDRSVQ